MSSYYPPNSTIFQAYKYYFFKFHKRFFYDLTINHALKKTREMKSKTLFWYKIFSHKRKD